MVRSVTPQKPQRATVSTDTSPLSLHKSDRGTRGPQEQRQYPGTALGLMLVVGILLGLLFAAVISSFVGGGASGNGPKTPASASASASASTTSQKAKDLQRTQRSDQIQSDESSASRDIRILGCGSDANGFASAQVLITNSTSKRSTYYVRVIFAAASDGRTISDDVASVKHLLPGATAPLQPVNAVDAAPGEQVLCRLGSVSRF